ncbi:MAG: hypothetical protein U0003_00540 [Vampirovibrionales bacterium]
MPLSVGFGSLYQLTLNKQPITEFRNDFQIRLATNLAHDAVSDAYSYMGSTLAQDPHSKQYYLITGQTFETMNRALETPLSQNPLFQRLKNLGLNFKVSLQNVNGAIETYLEQLLKTKEPLEVGAVNFNELPEALSATTYEAIGDELGSLDGTN